MVKEGLSVLMRRLALGLTPLGLGMKRLLHGQQPLGLGMKPLGLPLSRLWVGL